MRIRVGYELTYDCPQPTPMLLVLNVHYSRMSDMERPDYILTSPSVAMTSYRDSFGNWCNRVVAPKGQTTFTTDTIVRDSGLPDVIVPDAPQHAVEGLPDDVLLYLLGSRYRSEEHTSELQSQ